MDFRNVYNIEGINECKINQTKTKLINSTVTKLL